MKKLFYTAVLVVAIGLCAAGTTRSKKNDIARNLNIFNSLVKEVQTFYVDSIDSEKAIRTAIQAMLSELDPYTVYIPQDEQADFKSFLTGEYGGIGSYIQERNGKTYISQPQEGSPAAEAGLRPGDLIMLIDNDTVLGLPSDKVSEKLKGQAGTTVKVVVSRPYVEDSIMTFEMVRRKIQIPTVPYYGMLRDGMGYISLTTFNDRSANEVKDALTQLKKNPELKSLVFDLRDNTGGSVESAIKILGYFLPKGTEVMRTRGKTLLDEKVYKTTNAPIDTEIPMVVLIDGQTASSSEITAGALQDLDRAVIIGSRSYGKGLVQTTRQLPYDGLLKVTIAKYYIPSGRLIQAIDYSHRNDDGSVNAIPDSLTNEFKTRNGRTVRDGGGITPDITVTYPEVTRITFNVVRDNWAFDYATRYAARNKELGATPQTFEITDSIYADFKGFIDPERFNYDKVCENMLNRLRETAKVEGYMTDSVQAQFDLLEAMLRHPLDKDLDTHRKAIEPYLAREIVSRYYNQRGEIASMLPHDVAIDSAATVLGNLAEYRRLLSPDKKDSRK